MIALKTIGITLLLAFMNMFPSPGLGKIMAQETNDTTSSPAVPSFTQPAPNLRWYTMFTNIPGDWARVGETTIHTGALPAMAGITALTAALLSTDRQTWTLSRTWYGSNAITRRLSDFFVYFGDGRSLFTVSAVFGAYGLSCGDQRALRTGSQLVEVILSGGLAVQLLKHITGRERPSDASVPTGRWRFLPNQMEYMKHVPRYDAFPSGHIESAVATVTVVAENYPEWKWVRPVGYSACVLLAIGLVNNGIHWYSDYPLGISLGYTFGMIVSHPESENPKSPEDAQRLVVAPLIVPNGIGISLVWRY